MMNEKWQQMLKSEGGELTLSSGYRLLLIDPTVLFYVQKGELDVFAVHVAAADNAVKAENFTTSQPEFGFLTGKRAIFIATLSQGDVAFGVDVSSGDYIFFLYASEDSQLVKMSLNRESIAQQDDLWQSYAANWMAKLALFYKDSTHQDLELPAIADPNDTLMTLTQFHTSFLSSFRTHLNDEEKKQQIYTAKRVKNDEEKLFQSLQRMKKMLTGETFDNKTTEDPFIRVCQIVAQANQIQLTGNKPVAATLFKNKIQEIALRSHIYYRIVTLNHDWWKQDAGNLISYRKDSNTPIALIRKNGRYIMIDPEGKPQGVVVDETVSQLIADEAGMLYRPFPSENRLTGWEIFKFGLSGMFDSYKTIIFVGLLATIVGLVLPVTTAIIFGYVIPHHDFSLFSQVLLGLLLMSASVSGFLFIRALAVLRLTGLMNHKMESALWMRMLDLPMLFYRRYAIGDLLQRVSTVTNLRMLLSGYIVGVIINALFSIIYLAAMFYFNMALSVITVIVMLLCSLLTLFCFSKGLKINRRLLEYSATMSSKTLQMISGISCLRRNGAEKRFFASWIDLLTQSNRWQLDINNLGVGLNTLNSVLMNIAYAAIFFVQMELLLQLFGQGKVTATSLGYFFGFNAAFMNFIAAMLGINGSTMSLVSILPMWRRAQVILDEPLEWKGNKNSIEALSGHIKMVNVSFKYEGSMEQILNDISIEIHPGEFIAIVGPTGGGKTTLIRLLLGFETPTQGKIYYDDRDMAQLDMQSVRRQLGVVLQTNALLDGDILENVTSGQVFTDEEVMAALDAACFTEDLKNLPMGLKTPLSNRGTSLSGGQRQKLLIARAILSGKKILILDEGTNALDNLTQNQIMQNLENHHVTKIIVAHRLSTIQKADRIYVIKHGQVVEQGSFSELVSQSGVFANYVSYQNLN